MHKKVNESVQENGDFAEQKKKGQKLLPSLTVSLFAISFSYSYAVFFCLDKV